MHLSMQLSNKNLTRFLTQYTKQYRFSRFNTSRSNIHVFLLTAIVFKGPIYTCLRVFFCQESIKNYFDGNEKFFDKQHFATLFTIKIFSPYEINLPGGCVKCPLRALIQGQLPALTRVEKKLKIVQFWLKVSSFSPKFVYYLDSEGSGPKTQAQASLEKSWKMAKSFYFCSKICLVSIILAWGV